MTIRRPGRWLLGFTVLFVAAMWVIGRTFDAVTLGRILWLTYVIGSMTSLLLLLRRRGARPSIVSITTTLAAGLVFAWVLGLDVRWWIHWLLLGIVAMPAMAIANAAYRADVRRAQRRREAHAATLARTVVAGLPVEPYALYLRPFISTDRLIAQALPSELTPMEVPVYLDTETVLTRSLRGTLPLIGLGRNDETEEGVARITTSDDDWQQTVQKLARRASFITMVPLARPGTTWELEWLANDGLLERVLFLMPEVPYSAPSGVWIPKVADDRVFDAGVRSFDAEAHMLDIGREWTDASRAALTLRIELPPLAAVGGMFTIDPVTRTVKDIVPLGLSSFFRPLGYFRSTMMRFGFLPASKSRPVDFDTTFDDAVWLGGSTLEFALMRAADGMVVWRNDAAALRLVRKAIVEGRPNPSFVASYCNSLPGFAEERISRGEVAAAQRYVDFALVLRADPQLAPWVSDDVMAKLEKLVVAR